MVKVKEVKHSDEEISSSDDELNQQESMEDEYDDEYGEEEGDVMNPFEDVCEENEVDEDDYDEEDGEMDMEDFLDAASDLMNESGEGESEEEVKDAVIVSDISNEE